jgi:Ala-tRNA(Pro) deacylase
MTVAHNLEHYLNWSGIESEVVAHRRTSTAARTAKASHLPADQLAKGVLLRDGVGYLLAVVPASHQVDLHAVGRLCGRPVTLADEDEIGRLFPDCEFGAVPPIGAAYGLPAIVDDVLAGQPDVYLEAGDHLSLLHLRGEQFVGLMQDVRHGWFSSPN